MMKDFILPDIGEGIVECELLKWLVAEGDVIKEDQAVAEVMTDKATVEIPAMFDGVVEKLYYKEGDIAKVHAPLFAMQTEKSAEQSTQRTEASADIQSSTDSTSNTALESFVLPDIGEGIVECEIVKWSVSEGDEVEEDQVIVEVMTDKAVVEIPAKHAGKIATLHYKEGDIAKVHAPLFDLMLDSASTSPQMATSPSTQATVDSAHSSNIAPNSAVPASTASRTSKQGENFEAPISSTKAIASPAVRRLARESNVSLDTLKGSGKKGRILRADVLRAAEDQSMQTSVVDEQSASAILPAASANNTGAKSMLGSSDRVEAISGIRAAMARQMLASTTTIPHFSVSDELVMDNLIALRSSLKPQFEKEGIKLSFMPFFIKALSLAMLEFPVINSRLNEQGTELSYLSSHNIGLAVDSKIGLLVPSIKNVQSLSLKEVAVELNRLVENAREGRLSKSDISGGTISISNIGAIGGITATPVINKPDVAIVALGKTQKLPRFNEKGKVFAQHVMMINWSGDHRVIDGATMVKFNNRWMEFLRHPEQMLVNLR
ncbi:dihydrolipoyllysine-residue acetyltransferase [Ningiella sp. W23]|uniref:dihydrolipoyllysine-residue acetyltransferase n=1 Tax=Ningiella sp. W23 TaxID=3023715 RepID=UPI0037571379